MRTMCQTLSLNPKKITSSQHKYYRGGLLYSICEGLGIPQEHKEKASRQIHEAIKKCFDISSFSSLSVSEFERIASVIRMIASREWGYVLREPDEFDFDPNTISMKEFLKLKGL